MGEREPGSGNPDVCLGVPSRGVVLKATRLVRSGSPSAGYRQDGCPPSMLPGEFGVKGLWRGGAGRVLGVLGLLCRVVLTDPVRRSEALLCGGGALSPWQQAAGRGARLLGGGEWAPLIRSLATGRCSSSEV